MKIENNLKPCILMSFTVLISAVIIAFAFRHDVVSTANPSVVYVLDRWTGEPTYCKKEHINEVETFLGCYKTKHRRQ